MRVVSIDCATKSLAVSIIDYNLDVELDIQKAINEYETRKLSSETDDEKTKLKNFDNLLAKITTLENNKFDIKYLDVVDLIPGKKVTETDIPERTFALYQYLTKLDAEIAKDSETKNKSPKDILFLIEFQMGPNVKSGTISSQLIYHFSKFKVRDNIKLVGPSLKNKIVIGGSESHYSNFIGKYKTNYAANKNHSKHNLLKLLQYLKKEEAITNIKSKNIDDIADSVLMSLAYMIKHMNFEI